MQIKLNIIENEEVIESVVRETTSDLSLASLTSALEDFRQITNEVFTKKILKNEAIDISDDESSTSDDEKECPKKKSKRGSKA
ncbi:unnamed protein product [Colias eurytheme]|nr:unnamed protein product [Colias eurytheme]